MLKNQFSFVFHCQKYYGKWYNNQYFLWWFSEIFTNRKQIESVLVSQKIPLFLFPFWEFFSFSFYTPTTMVIRPLSKHSSCLLLSSLSLLPLHSTTMALYQHCPDHHPCLLTEHPAILSRNMLNGKLRIWGSLPWINLVILQCSICTARRFRWEIYTHCRCPQTSAPSASMNNATTKSGENGIWRYWIHPYGIDQRQVAIRQGAAEAWNQMIAGSQTLLILDMDTEAEEEAEVEVQGWRQKSRRCRCRCGGISHKCPTPPPLSHWQSPTFRIWKSHGLGWWHIALSVAMSLNIQWINFEYTEDKFKISLNSNSMFIFWI